MTPATPASEDPRHLIFQVGGHTHAIGLLEIREIAECESIDPLPAAAGVLRGVVDLRGRAVPVLDLAAMLGLPPTETAREVCVLLVDAHLDGRAALLGLLVGCVSRVAEVPHDAIQPILASKPGASRNYLKGIARLEERFVPVLDLERILAAPDLAGEAPSTQQEGAGAPPSSIEPA